MKLKPMKVDIIRSSNQRVWVDAMLDRNTTTFFAVVLTKRIEAASMLELKKLVRARLDATQSYEWEPLIEVSVHNESRYRDDGESASVQLTFRRFDRAVDLSSTHASSSRSGKCFVERPHELDVGHFDQEDRDVQKDVSECHIHRAPGPAIPKDHEPALLVYDQAVWDRLVQLQQAIVELRKHLVELVGRDDLATVLLLKSALTPLAAHAFSRGRLIEDTTAPLAPLVTK